MTADCCDEPGQACVDGIPSACDAKCATSYVTFYEDCKTTLAAFMPDEMDAYDAFYETCTSLSTPLLLAASIQCVVGTDFWVDSDSAAPCSDSKMNGGCSDARQRILALECLADPVCYQVASSMDLATADASDCHANDACTALLGCLAASDVYDGDGSWFESL